MSFDRDAWIKNALRRASYKYPPRNAVKIAARRARGKYECAICHKLTPHKELNMDHVEPVVPVEGASINPKTGKTDWNEYIERLYPLSQGWQALCFSCHQEKSIKENEQRSKNKQKK